MPHTATRIRLLPALLPLIAVAGLALGIAVARADPLATIPPAGPGPYGVACSNVTQDFTRLRQGERAQDYWDGYPDGLRPRYVADLLSSLDQAFYLAVPIPDDSELYGRYAGASIATVSIVCYPTGSDNPRPDYLLPTGSRIPHMHRLAESPIWPDSGTRFPVLLFSHGLAGSPISSEYLDAISVFASHGYVVVAPFHGDPRVADVRLEDFADIGYALIHYKDFIALQALRPLELKAVLDAFLVHPMWRDRLDASRIGIFGASIGGESAMLLGGAALTTTLGQASKPVVHEPRIGAAVGYVPYFGISVYPAFGRDQRGLDGVALPFLALSGTADTTAPIGPVRAGMHRLAGTRQLVALQGVQHGFAAAFSDDIFTWALAFLAGQLSGDPRDRAQSARMTNVAGGGDDRLEQDYSAPSPAAADERIAVEYYTAVLDHYFITAEPAEAAMLDAGILVPGWRRTGLDFKVRPAGDARGLAACRFFGTPGIGPNSHFFTIDADECAKVRANPFWTFEGLAFNAEAPASGVCPPDRVPVTRMYNDGKGGQANHRYLTSHAEIGDMLGEQWIVAGPVFCALP
jgi:predicted dienelactone hydrolase